MECDSKEPKTSLSEIQDDEIVKLLSIMVLPALACEFSLV
jgi:hypothetical protein